MATVADVVRIVSRLPGVSQEMRHGSRTCVVGGKAFLWERPFSKADLRRFGEAAPPDGPILAVYLGDCDLKDVILASDLAGVFTIPHFDGFPAVLVQLRATPVRVLRQVIQDGWDACAPLS